MDRDTVIALAREVGLWEMLEGYSSEYGSLDAEEDCLPELQRFAALVAAHEREECAKILDGAPRLVPSLQFPGGHCFVCGLNSEKIAAAIRSRTLLEVTPAQIAHADAVGSDAVVCPNCNHRFKDGS